MRSLMLLILLLITTNVRGDKPPPNASREWHADNCARCCRHMWGPCGPPVTKTEEACIACPGKCMPRQFGGNGEYANCREPNFRCPPAGCADGRASDATLLTDEVPGCTPPAGCRDAWCACQKRCTPPYPIQWTATHQRCMDGCNQTYCERRR